MKTTNSVQTSRTYFPILTTSELNLRERMDQARTRILERKEYSKLSLHANVKEWHEQRARPEEIGYFCPDKEDLKLLKEIKEELKTR